MLKKIKSDADELMNYHMAETNPKQEQLQTTMTIRCAFNNAKNNLKELMEKKKLMEKPEVQVKRINIKSCQLLNNHDEFVSC